ncbi:MAG: hypothetical protein GY863_08000 [bacterium]|nr:hypothetical protein [bacterium]
MNTITRELAGISASISAISCHYLEYHLDNALKSGATDDQIRNAVIVGLNIIESIDYRIIKMINSKLPGFDINEIFNGSNTLGNYWIRIPF